MNLDPGDLAARNARRMATVLRELGGDGGPVADGWMSCDQPGSWATFASGLGVDGPVSDRALDRLVDFYAERGRPAAVEVTPYQHPTLFAGLAARGFVVADLETILVRSTREPLDPPRVPGCRVRLVDPDDPDDVQALVAVQTAVFHEDPATVGGFEAIARRVARHPGSRSWLVELDGEVAGSAALDLYDGAAHLFSGAVLPAFRRRGLQAALIAHRVRAAAEAGAEQVLIGCSPGSPTERNALRAGFQVVYTQLFLKRRLRWGAFGP